MGMPGSLSLLYKSFLIFIKIKILEDRKDVKRMQDMVQDQRSFKVDRYLNRRQVSENLTVMKKQLATILMGAAHSLEDKCRHFLINVSKQFLTIISTWAQNC